MEAQRLKLDRRLEKLCAGAKRKGNRFPPKRPSDLKYAEYPTPQEYTTFPKGYQEDHWAIEFIYADKGSEKEPNLEFLVEWKPNPVTGLRFEPSWVPYKDLIGNTYLEWLQELQQIAKDSQIRPQRIIDDTSSEVEDTGTLEPIENISDTIEDSGFVESRSPSIEIADSQGAAKKPAISVVIPARPFDKSEYLIQSVPTSFYSPLASVDPESPVVVSTSLETVRSSYPTPSTEPEDSPQSPADSILLNTIFYSEPLPSSTTEAGWTVPQDTNSQQQQVANQVVFAVGPSQPTVVVPASSSELQQIVQVEASRSVASQRTENSQSQSAQVLPNFSTSPATDSQFSLGPNLLDLGDNFQSPVASQPEKKLFVPFQQELGLSVEAKPFARKLVRPLAAMGTPSQRSGSSVPRPSPPSRNSRGPTLTLQEQLSQSRASRRRNGPLGSPLEISTPIPNPIGEPATVVLSRMNSSSQRKSPQPIDEDSSSAMQVDASETSLTSPTATKSATYDTAAAPISLQIHQSIENADVDQSTQGSGQSTSSQTFGYEQAGSGTLMPNYPILGPAEYVIPLHAEGKTQEAYSEAVRLKSKALLRFIRRRRSSSTASASTTPNNSDAAEMSELVERLDATTTLLDLGYDNMLTQTSYTSEQLAKWAAQASSKFAFLELLIKELRDKNVSVVIYSKPGATQKVLENFFSVLHVKHEISPTPSSQFPSATFEGLLTVYLIASGQRLDSLETPRNLSLIIALDTSFNAGDQIVEQIRQKPAGGLIPIIHLLISHSSEHIERCLPRNLPSPQRNRLLMRCIFESHSHMGRINATMPMDVVGAYYDEISRALDENGQHHMQTQGHMFQKIPERHLKFLVRQVAQAVLDGNPDSWLRVTPMPLLEFNNDISSEPTSAVLVHSPAPAPASPVGTPTTRKRLLDGETSDTAAGNFKRQRLTPLPGVVQASESAESALQIQNLIRALRAAQDELAAEKQGRLDAEKAKEHTQDQLNEWRQEVSKLQKRVEHYKTDSHENRSKLKVLELKSEQRVGQNERDQAENGKLKVELAQLRGDLVLARMNLVSAGGDVAALETAREEARTNALKLATSERSLASHRKDFDFMRSQYQEASAKAVENAQQVTALEEEAVALRQAASEERRKLKEVNHRESIKAHVARIEKVELEKKNLEMLNRKMDEEIKMLRKNRGVTTRASSVQPQPPGSPRAKSRGGSPVPGLLAAVAAAHAGNRASALRHER